MATLISAILGHRIHCELIDTGVGATVWSVRFFERGRPDANSTYYNQPGIAGVKLHNALAGAENLARTWQWEAAR